MPGTLRVCVCVCVLAKAGRSLLTSCQSSLSENFSQKKKKLGVQRQEIKHKKQGREGGREKMYTETITYLVGCYFLHLQHHQLTS